MLELICLEVRLNQNQNIMRSRDSKQKRHLYQSGEAKDGVAVEMRRFKHTTSQASVSVLQTGKK